jgi:hypothetical protein
MSWAFRLLTCLLYSLTFGCTALVSQGAETRDQSNLARIMAITIRGAEPGEGIAAKVSPLQLVIRLVVPGGAGDRLGGAEK